MARIETAEDLEQIVDEQNARIAALETQQADLLGLINIQADALRKMQDSFDEICGRLTMAAEEVRALRTGRKGQVH